MTVHVKDTDGRYVVVNADMAAELGQQAESLIGKRADDVFPEAYARQVREREQHLIVTGEATPLFEEEYRDHGGRSSTWLARKVPLRDDHGMVKYIVSVGVDITDRKKAEETVRESQSLLRAIIDAVPATVTVKDLKGRYVIVNAYQAPEPTDRMVRRSIGSRRIPRGLCARDRGARPAGGRNRGDSPLL
jgi:PAS domain S-box-containing protein